MAVVQARRWAGIGKDLQLRNSSIFRGFSPPKNSPGLQGPFHAPFHAVATATTRYHRRRHLAFFSKAAAKG